MIFPKIKIIKGQKEKIIEDVILSIDKDILFIIENNNSMQNKIFEAKFPILKSISENIIEISCYEKFGIDKNGRDILKSANLYVFK